MARWRRCTACAVSRLPISCLQTASFSRFSTVPARALSLKRHFCPYCEVPVPMQESSAPRSRFAVRLNLWLLGFTRHWLRYVLLFFGLYLSFSLLTPVMMHFGLTGPARV